jgi:RNA polymerase sigma factor (sigma-70 family)
LTGTTIRGAARAGAGAADEGELTEAVVRRLARKDGRQGHEVAVAFRIAKRALWRVLEAHEPRRLAEALRARSDPLDPSGRRGGVRELRLALADWLDPPPTCRRCHRPIVAGSELVWCRSWGSRIPPPPPPGVEPWAPARFRCQPTAPWSRPARCGTLALFVPPPWTPEDVARRVATCSGAYDVVADRDGTALLAASAADDLHPEVAEARGRFLRAYRDAVGGNGRLVIKTQLKLYRGRDGVTRADLVQEGAIGLIRGLMDFDPDKERKDGTRGARIASYAPAWIRQGMGQAYQERRVVRPSPAAEDARRDVERAGVDPGDLLALAEAAVGAVRRGDGSAAAALRALGELPVRPPPPPPSSPIAAAAEKKPRRRRRKRPTAPPPLVPRRRLAGWVRRAEAAVAAALRPRGGAYRHADDGDAGVQCLLTLAGEALALKHKGPALLRALRHRDHDVVGLATSDQDRDDAAASARHGGPLRVVDLADEGPPDPEELAAQQAQRDALFAALERLRQRDPTAAEVVRRHEGLEVGQVDDGETFREIAERGLATLAGQPAPCRETIRKLYERARRELRADLAGFSRPGGGERSTFSNGSRWEPPPGPEVEAGPTPARPLRREEAPVEDFDAFRAAADSVAW